jgi:adenylate cyclase
MGEQASAGKMTAEIMDTQEEKLHKSLLIFACALMNLAVMLWLAMYWYMGIDFSSNVPFGYQIISVSSLVYYLKKRNFTVFRFIQLSLFLFAPFIMQWSIGSSITASGVMLWALMAPVGAVVVSGWRESIPWFIAYLMMTLLSGVFDYYLAPGDTFVPMHIIGVFFAINFAAMSSIIYFLLRYFVLESEKIKDQLDLQHELLAQEQKKSERLLFNVLPAKIAHRLKNGDGLIADSYADVSVMFADLVNFTQLTAQLSPEQIVSLLNTIFSGFDELSEKYGLEKIKTIGDAYMVVGGLTRERAAEYVGDVADMALEMRRFVAQHPELVRYKMGIHIGIATGAAVAGVIGSKRFIYDLWGDTVNVASRLTDDASDGVILVDKPTYQRLQHHYAFDEPNIINVKGKGEMSSYRLLSLAAAPSNVYSLRTTEARAAV